MRPFGDSLKAVWQRRSLLATTLLSITWIGLLRGPAPGADAAGFTKLTALPAPRIAAAAEAFDENYRAENILEPPAPGSPWTEYASRGLGASTFIDFDFGQPVSVAGYRHVQRRTPDTIAEAKLIFSDSADFKTPLATVKIAHVDEPGATTFKAFAPVKARHVRWQVTVVAPGRSLNTGGKSIELFAPGGLEPAPGSVSVEARAVPVISREDGALTQPLRVTLGYPYAEAVSATVRLEGQAPRPVELRFGNQTLEYAVVAPEVEKALRVSIEVGGQSVASRTVKLPAARKLTVYILPHSHTDIGYTAIQTDIEEKQVNNLLEGIAAARRTASYPEGARFVWNVEVLWAADLLLGRLSPTQCADFLDAVKRGEVALNGMYLNELTGLCRPEELLRLFRLATILAERTGVPVDSAMISDVPGYTWGTVTAMAQAGIRYWSVAPNYFDRIGTILVEWENKPFWWVGPDGQSKVLVWIPFWGYAMSHRYGSLSPRLVEEFCSGLESRVYPYDIAYVRWSGHGDNAVPDPVICDFVKEWNEAHVWPRFVISSTSDAFRAFEERYGDRLPQVRGDWTPYWEDGAGSSAAETALNRASSERLTQAETLWAMLAPKPYPAERFEEAWSHVLLYSEHTWGAHCSISEPANPFTLDQWTIKQSYATVANLASRQLIVEATSGGEAPERPLHDSQVDVYNTSSWTRSELVFIPQELSGGGDAVLDEEGRSAPSQRLASRELAVLVTALPPFSGRRYTVTRGTPPPVEPAARLSGAVLENGKVRVRLDEATGGIVELRAGGIEANLADTSNGQSLNEYLYLVGDDLAALERSKPPRIAARDRGPLVASLLVESDAPGCHGLTREVRLVAGADHVELLDTVDKKRLEARSYHAREGKESVNFGFAFNVPQGEMRIDVPLGLVRPESDQMPSACKNWLTVGRWVDVSNPDFGVTWVTLDAPLIEVGGLTATLLNSQTNPAVWRKRIERTQKLYAWAMNNHWGTNYRAYQEGPVQFRFVLRPHRGTTPAEASRFATGFSQPLLAVPGRGAPPPREPLLRVEPPEVLVTALKPSDDGKGLIVRLLGSSDAPTSATLSSPRGAPAQVYRSDTSERPLERLSGKIEVPAWGVVTLRLEAGKEGP